MNKVHKQVLFMPDSIRRMKINRWFVLLFIICASCKNTDDDAVDLKSKKTTERYISFESYQMKNPDDNLYYKHSKEPAIELLFQTNFPPKTKVIVAKTLFFNSADDRFHAESVPEVDIITIHSSNFTIPYAHYYVTGGFKLSVYPSKEDTLLKQPFHSFYSVSYKLDTIKGHERIPVFPIELIVQKDRYTY